MRGTVLYGANDIRSENLDAPKILEPNDAIIKIGATCVCGSDLWPYRGIRPSMVRYRWVTNKEPRL